MYIMLNLSVCVCVFVCVCVCVCIRECAFLTYLLEVFLLEAILELRVLEVFSQAGVVQPRFQVVQLVVRDLSILIEQK